MGINRFEQYLRLSGVELGSDGSFGIGRHGHQTPSSVCGQCGVHIKAPGSCAIVGTMRKRRAISGESKVYL